MVVCFAEEAEMSNQRPAFTKRQRERDKLQKKEDKAERRAQRRAEREARSSGHAGEDPDIAGIIPGPQAQTEDDA